MTYSLLPQVEIADGVAVTTSLAIAEHFNKRHDNLVAAIRDLQLSDSFRDLNFQESKYIPNGQTRSYPMYYLTKNGFIFLVMGFTGEEAGRIKEAYINAFDQMEAQLRQLSVSSIESELSVWLKKYVALQEKYIALQEKLQTYELKNVTAESPKPLRRRRLTEEMIQQILELYQQGYTQTEIARVVGYSTATISVVVRQRRNH